MRLNLPVELVAENIQDRIEAWLCERVLSPHWYPFGDGGAERGREITAQELGALLSGIDLSTAKRRKGYRRESA
jgi:hypothetical protein